MQYFGKSIYNYSTIIPTLIEKSEEEIVGGSV